MSCIKESMTWLQSNGSRPSLDDISLTCFHFSGLIFLGNACRFDKLPHPISLDLAMR